MSAMIPHGDKRGEKNRPAPPSSFSARAARTSDKHRKVRNITTAADYAELERRYTFVPSHAKSSWQDRMVNHYHSHLYKEYVLADLRRPGQVGLRWRTQQEVQVGKGHSTCGNKHCPSYGQKPDNDESLAAYYQSQIPSTDSEEQCLLDQVPHGLGLHDYEVNFGYTEDGVQKNELVKLRLCLRCAPRLFHTKGGALGARRARQAMDQQMTNQSLEDANPEKTNSDNNSDSSSSVDESAVASRRKRRKHSRKRSKRKKRHYSASSDSGESLSGEDIESRSAKKQHRDGDRREKTKRCES